MAIFSPSFWAKFQFFQFCCVTMWPKSKFRIRTQTHLWFGPFSNVIWIPSVNDNLELCPNVTKLLLLLLSCENHTKECGLYCFWLNQRAWALCKTQREWNTKLKTLGNISKIKILSENRNKTTAGFLQQNHVLRAPSLAIANVCCTQFSTKTQELPSTFRKSCCQERRKILASGSVCRQYCRLIHILNQYGSHLDALKFALCLLWMMVRYPRPLNPWTQEAHSTAGHQVDSTALIFLHSSIIKHWMTLMSVWPRTNSS